MIIIDYSDELDYSFVDKMPLLEELTINSTAIIDAMFVNIIRL